MPAAADGELKIQQAVTAPSALEVAGVPIGFTRLAGPLRDPKAGYVATAQNCGRRWRRR